jgi:tagaturonate epimerase
MLTIEPFTVGVGDRFAHQGVAQLQAMVRARDLGIPVYPVWNKSYREHSLIKTKPDDVRGEAAAAVSALGWTGAYYVDADHINRKNVSEFIRASNFFTIDVADFTGRPADPTEEELFVKAMSGYTKPLPIPGISRPLELSEPAIRAAARKFLAAVREAGCTYREIVSQKGADNFVTEVSMDETETAQTPVELFLILAMSHLEEIPIQTIAPKFNGRFNKGVDYSGDLAQFAKEFDEDLSVVAFAIQEFGLPKSLKLSVHSGSDKFSLYPIINRLIKKWGAGLHLKTAGTTWLEEMIGLAEAGNDGLEIAKEIYAQAFARFDELKGPYLPVIDIDPKKLPDPARVNSWTSRTYVSGLRHDESNPEYNPHFRQLLHIAFRIAAEMGDRFLYTLKTYETSVAGNVTRNLFERHIRPIFG